MYNMADYTHTYLPPSDHGRKSYLSAILPSHLLVGEGLITQFIHQRKLVLHAPGINLNPTALRYFIDKDRSDRALLMKQAERLSPRIVFQAQK